MTIFLYAAALFSAGYWLVHRYAVRALRRQLGWLPWALTLAIYLVAAVSPRPEPLLVMTALAPLVRPRGRLDVACRYALMMPLIPDLTATIFIAGHVIAQFAPFTTFGLGALVASAVAREMPPAPPRPRFHAEQAAVALLLVVFGVAAPRFADASALARGFGNELALLVLPFFLLVRTVRTRAEFALVLACLAAAAVPLSVMALWEHHAGWSLFDALTAHMSATSYMARSASVRGGALRPAVTMGGPIEFGIFLALALFALALSLPFLRSRRVGLAMIGLVFLGMLSAQSRGALISVGAGLLVIFLAQRRWALAGVIAAAGATAYGLLLLASDSSVRVAAFMGAGQNYGQFRDYRTLLLARGLQEGAKHRWLGASLDQVTAELSDLTQGEHIVDLVNTYLNVYLVAGLLGLGLLLVALAGVYRQLFRRTGPLLRRAAEQPRLFCLGALTTLLISLATTSFYGRVPFMLVLVLAGARLVRATDVGPAPRPRTEPAEPRREAARVAAV